MAPDWRNNEPSGGKWSVYSPSNSGLPYYAISALMIDQSGNKWIGTTQGGLASVPGRGVIMDIKNNSTVLPVISNYTRIIRTRLTLRQ